jgi:hypothetical protein
MSSIRLGRDNIAAMTLNFSILMVISIMAFSLSAPHLGQWYPERNLAEHEPKNSQWPEQT